MNRVVLRDVRSVARVTFELPEPGEVVLICGANRAGKTTIAHAVAALVTRDPSIFGATKKAADVMVGGKDRNPEISLADVGYPDESAISFRFPDRKREEIGERVDKLPMASSIAAGTFRIATASKADVAAWLALSLDAIPTYDEFAAAAADSGLADTFEPFAKLARRICPDPAGWDGVTAAIDEEIRTMKGRWTETAEGRAYGSTLATTWVPKKWRGTEYERSHINEVIETLERSTEQVQQTAKAKIAIDAAIEAEREQLERAVELGKTAAKELADARKVLGERRAEVEKLRQATSPVIVCPQCQTTLRLDRSGPVVAETGAKVPKRLDEPASALALAEAGLEEAIRREETLARSAGAGRSAETKLKLLPPKPASTTEPAVDPATEFAERLAMARKIARADEIHDRIFMLTALSKLAGPQGLRARKMEECLIPFRRDLDKIARLMGLPDLVLDDDRQFFVAGHPYGALCESEQWQVDAAIAIAIGRLDGSAIVILDRADILETALRKRLFATLKAARVAALVTMTMNGPDGVPNLAKAGLGRSYWLADGALQALPERAAA